MTTNGTKALALATVARDGDIMAGTCGLELRHDTGDGRYRWYQREDGADTEVSGRTIRDALAQARAAWGATCWNLCIVR